MWLGVVVSHRYWSVGELTVTLTVYNRVSTNNATLVVTVQDVIHSQLCSACYLFSLALLIV